ncbi:Mannitol 2-dehydrogenase [Thalassovita autumnalis]|uniref:Mannitol 2-dehydrogenase n=1 Tax=Thalassovita autumnalis TaxID=2072972 RepID=A0A0P1FUE0_9RHOB|nr:mannitol dehydrogenase family protein [Thalassovita autumnalis]CUH69991.1 Mannitol 2-dehydrogenase [Thalassovita autumnalis]CUH72379.1 Mannitol 2-dehydrogenase [Thalassovita autumnalis]
MVQNSQSKVPELLDNNSVKNLPADVLQPAYDRAQVTNGIVHLGVGNFHRGHQAVYTDDVLGRGDLSWGIVGVSLRSPRIKNTLSSQDYLYSVNCRENDKERFRVIGSISEVICAPEDPARVLEELCRPEVKIVTLTITEKGYVWPEDQSPDWTPSNFEQSSASALLYIVEALYTRQKRRLPLFTLLSCDNLVSNGKTLKSAVIKLAQRKDARFAAELASSLACPCSMVDRIVPATSEADISAATKKLALQDQAAIVTEPFSQWVIEDDFPQGRPDWSLSDGVSFVTDVVPYEEMKLRLLNGAHTFIALYGELTGRTYVNEVMQSKDAVAFLQRYWRNTIRSLRVDGDLNHYVEKLTERFKNESLLHKTSQIVSDTSQKLPQRIIEPWNALNNIGGETSLHSVIFAMWVEYLRGAELVDDPLESVLVPLAREGDYAKIIKEVPAIMMQLQDNIRAIEELVSCCDTLHVSGIEKVVSEVLKDYEPIV